MKKQSKQRIHRNWMDTRMPSLFKKIGLPCIEPDKLKSVGYWFIFDEIDNYQHQQILKSHPRPELVQFCFITPRGTDKIKKSVLILAY